MKIAIVGPGRMGAACARIAGERGHAVVARLDAEAMARPLAPADLGAADVALEFTRPEVAKSNVGKLLAAGVSVVSGTTGWSVDAAMVDAAERAGAGLIVAPNFSPGMHLFYRVVREAARTLGSCGLYQSWLHESHHRGKRDMPGGTALRLADELLQHGTAVAEIVHGQVEGPLAPGALHVTATRAGSIPGTHEIGFDGEADTVTLVHAARNRTGFALGAVLAAEWLSGKVGLYPFERVVDALLETSAPGGAKETT